MQAYIFDLDGVVVDTATFHFKAWGEISERLGFELTQEMNEHLKGISREDSLRKVLQWSGREVSSQEFLQLAHQKNALYLKYVSRLTPADTLPGVRSYLSFLRDRNKLIALGSASRNAHQILHQLQIDTFFNVIIDGNEVTRTKPDPQVFTLAAERLGVLCSDCVVFEDAHTGIQAAKNAGMRVIGIGNSDLLNGADALFASLEQYRDIEKFIAEL